MSSQPDVSPAAVRVVRRRARPASDERRWFLVAIRGQLAGARALAYLAVAVAVGAGAWWLVGTTGSPVVGIGFIALGIVIGASIWTFAGLMRMIGGAPGEAMRLPTGDPPPVNSPSPATPPARRGEPGAPPPPTPTRRTP